MGTFVVIKMEALEEVTKEELKARLERATHDWNYGLVNDDDYQNELFHIAFQALYELKEAK